MGNSERNNLTRMEEGSQVFRGETRNGSGACVILMDAGERAELAVHVRYIICKD